MKSVLKNVNALNMSCKMFKFSSLYNCKSIRKYSTPISNEHVYMKSQFENYEQLAVFLRNNVVYNKNGLIAVNKPYGLKRYNETERPFWKAKLNIKSSPASLKTGHLSMEKVLPYLATELGVPKLIVSKYPGRFCSGVCILTTSEESKTYIRKHSSPSLGTIYCFTAVCVGLPVKQSYDCKIGVSLLRKEESDTADEKKTGFMEDWSRRQLYRGDVKKVNIYHHTSCYDMDRSSCLVQIAVNRNVWNTVRAYLSARMLAPPLGDNMFSSRVKSISGVRMAIDPFHPAASLPQRLSLTMLEQLNLAKGSEIIIPVHLHLSSIKLPRVSVKEKEIILTAPLPDYFLWSCKKLKLDTNTLSTNVFDMLSEKVWPRKIKKKTSNKRDDNNNEDDNDDDYGDDNDDDYYMNYNSVH